MDLEAAEKAVAIASKALGGLCKARWESPEAWAKAWHWEIPANEELDTDLRIGKAISLCKDLIAEVRRLRSQGDSHRPPKAESESIDLYSNKGTTDGR